MRQSIAALPSALPSLCSNSNASLTHSTQFQPTCSPRMETVFKMGRRRWRSLTMATRIRTRNHSGRRHCGLTLLEFPHWLSWPSAKVRSFLAWSRMPREPLTSTLDPVRMAQRCLLLSDLKLASRAWRPHFPQLLPGLLRQAFWRLHLTRTRPHRDGPWKTA